jgi:hypothetical protein
MPAHIPTGAVIECGKAVSLPHLPKAATKKPGDARDRAREFRAIQVAIRELIELTAA